MALTPEEQQALLKKNPRSRRLTAKERDEILRRAAAGETHQSIANDIGCTHSAVGYVVRQAIAEIKLNALTPVVITPEELIKRIRPEDREKALELLQQVCGDSD